MREVLRPRAEIYQRLDGLDAINAASPVLTELAGFYAAIDADPVNVITFKIKTGSERKRIETAKELAWHEKMCARHSCVLEIDWSKSEVVIRKDTPN